MRILLILFVVLFITGPASAQVANDTSRPIQLDTNQVTITDTSYEEADIISPADSLRLANTTFDSVSLKPIVKDSGWSVRADLPLGVQVMLRHPYYSYNNKRISLSYNRKVFYGKETLFYVVTSLVLIFALLRHAFAKYVNDLFRVFFRTTMKQRQIREQLMQTPLPSLVFNLFFVASAGLYMDFLLHYFDIVPVSNFWLLYLYCCIGLAMIYFVKFLGLKICGWLFNMKAGADSYIFIVFIINKVIGIFLLPLLVLLAFTVDPVYSITLVISWAGIAVLLLYRFILGFSAVRNEVKFNLFHFFLYLCAFEVAPLLLIYRLLLLVF